MRLTSDPDPALRQLAAQSLSSQGRLGRLGEEGQAALARLTNDPDPALRRSAALGLAGLKYELLPELLPALSQSLNWVDRQSAAQLISRIARILRLVHNKAHLDVDAKVC